MIVNKSEPNYGHIRLDKTAQAALRLFTPPDRSDAYTVLKTDDGENNKEEDEL